ncbi:MAG: thiol peroxidase [Candidatus Omnitrophica bacterium]|nr:thiol peroxidase [Candidatus Omnitrophota bacterium]MDD5237922.1 thiol peroxidase [Candidatus Omnitrophota bacterium]
MPKIINFKGKPLTLVGRVLKIGVEAPDFKVTDGNLKEVRLSDFQGKIKVINSFPSLDTPVCEAQVKEFNQRATQVSKEIAIIGISKDLPFAQKRFCQDFDINNTLILSDYKTSSFGINYGLLVKELNLLARAVIILDKHDIIRYIQIVEELTSPPDYQEAFSQLETVVRKPDLISKKEELPSQCKPCEEGTPPLSKDKIEKLLAKYRGWELIEDRRLVKEFKFKDFIEAKYFLDLVSNIAEEQGHHPNLTLIYNKLKITLTTHAAGGLTENDFIMARIIDEIGG